MPLINMTGMRCARLVVTSRARNSASGRAMWNCRCDCGNNTVADGRNLRSGHTQSCGCLLPEVLSATRTVHGHTANGQYSEEFKTWSRMLTRCYNKNGKSYPEYGGRGIKVCERWLSFPNFYSDMGPKPSPEHSLDRYPNNDGNYEPTNCRWATKSQQARNRRSNLMVTFRGREMSLAEACEISSIPYHTAKQRIRKLGWDDERALTEPVNG